MGGLPWTTTTETLRRHFEQHGEIEESAVIFDKETGKSKGFGFVSADQKKQKAFLLFPIGTSFILS